MAIRKLLIANRGEIACRIIRSAQDLGIATVAVYSQADAGAMHVALADQAICLGPAPVAESYLRADKVLEAARQSGADAIHPGYGFLSENPDFAGAVAAAGLIFVGPSPKAIRAMGLKDGAKALMEDAGVPVVPGYHGAEQDPDFLAAKAAEIGYPVLIKARAGGGGKGMRLVEDPAEFPEALAAARREGEKSFGDPACLIEKYITQPRHIEIQIFGDSHGNVVHLFERDCSLQRRHQKVLEEAPAPDMTAQMRAAMGEAAVRAGQAVGYTGAGTVEFIVDGSGPLRPDGFWFMEMNTRLQVEHPVTEAITGQDLVALQLAVAQGAPLPFAQEDLSITGHSVELRLYAEDPAAGFLPATGRLDHLRFPTAQSGLRVDTGVRQGDEVLPFYDPMIAKLITHGPDRASALNQMAHALETLVIGGLTTNRSFLSRLIADADVAAGRVDTGLIGRKQDALTNPPAPQAEDYALGALALLAPPAAPSANPFAALGNFRLHGAARQQIRFAPAEPGGAAETVTLITHADGSLCAQTPGGEIRFGGAARDGDKLRYHLDGMRRDALVLVLGDEITVQRGGETISLNLYHGDAAGDEDQGGAIAAPMPGLVAQIAAAPGQTVEKGQTLVILEAMKMEHRLSAPRDGRIAEVTVAEGEQVAQGALLLALEPEDA
ncbi:MAG: acetyl/propionyl/methylcrotonyl-CoA carboxylase subunit alpha [Mangrovicoccus sp.]|nr:acetyl/propionyl/methylcrotonyl-CoA carboxylase subunit alpha [Mangrovicoccus sp.]